MVDDPQILSDLFPGFAALRDQIESHLEDVEHAVIDGTTDLYALFPRLLRCGSRIIQ